MTLYKMHSLIHLLHCLMSAQYYPLLPIKEALLQVKTLKAHLNKALGCTICLPTKWEATETDFIFLFEEIKLLALCYTV